MNYHHSYHVGNYGDVLKHIVLIALIQSLQQKEKGFCYLDTHAGIGLYDLTDARTKKNQEYETGIAKVFQGINPPALVSHYLAEVMKVNPDSSLHYYPGSPMLVRQLLRSQDRMILMELQEKAHEQLQENFFGDKQIAIHRGDGYSGLKAFLPPKEKRGLILIDPAYEKPDELDSLVGILSKAVKRWETGMYAVWYPVKLRQPVDRFQRKILENIARPILVTELNLYPENVPTHLNGSGMLIINPPYKLEEKIQAVLPWLWKCLSPRQQGNYHVKFLSAS